MPEITDQQVYDILCRSFDEALAAAAAAENEMIEAEARHRAADHKRILAMAARDSWRKLRPDVVDQPDTRPFTAEQLLDAANDGRLTITTEGEDGVEHDLPPNAWVQTADRFLQCYRPGTGVLYLEWNRDTEVGPNGEQPTMLEGWWLHSKDAGLHEPLFCGNGKQEEAIERATDTMVEWEIQTGARPHPLDIDEEVPF